MSKIAFKTKRLSAHFIDDINKNHVFELYSRPENIEFIQGISAENDIRLSIECYEIYQNLGAFLIFENETNKFVGIAGMQRQEPMADGSMSMSGLDVEFLIVTHKEFGGKGYASEFCAVFFEKLFTTFPQLELPARVNKNNVACIKLLKKFGFIEAGEADYHNYGNKFLLLKTKPRHFVRQANYQDLQDIVEICRENLLRNKKEDEISARGFLMSEMTEEYARNMIDSDSVVLVAEKNNKISGYLVAYDLANEDEIFQAEVRKIKGLENAKIIYYKQIAKRLNETGVGKNLLIELVKEASKKGYSHIVCKIVLAPFYNQASVNFHEKNGFVKMTDLAEKERVVGIYVLV